ncbi:MAG: hypothetical protein NVV74_21930 [Magnetospirillum sp.]|nr:hypothetical protein [Magnetospirillum sp.]
MALGSNRVSAIASPGMAAAATARPASGGRNVASVGPGVEGADFSPQIGVNDNRLWRYDEERSFDQERDGHEQEKATPFVMRAAKGFQVEESEDVSESGGAGRVFLAMVLRGIGIYETNMRLTTAGAVRPGSVLNFRF